MAVCAQIALSHRYLTLIDRVTYVQVLFSI